MSKLIAALVVSLLATSAASVDAAPLKYSFSGTWTTVTAAAGAPLFAENIPANTAFSGYLLVDGAAVDINPSPTSGTYTASLLSLVFTSHTFLPGLTGTRLASIANGTVDQAAFVGFLSGFTSGSFTMLLVDDQGTALTSDALPTTLDGSAFETRTLIITASNGAARSTYTGVLTDVRTDSVPEPSLLVAMASGLAFLTRRLRRA